MSLSVAVVQKRLFSVLNEKNARGIFVAVKNVGGAGVDFLFVSPSAWREPVNLSCCVWWYYSCDGWAALGVQPQPSSRPIQVP